MLPIYRIETISGLGTKMTLLKYRIKVKKIVRFSYVSAQRIPLVSSIFSLSSYGSQQYKDDDDGDEDDDVDDDDDDDDDNNNNTYNNTNNNTNNNNNTKVRTLWFIFQTQISNEAKTILSLDPSDRTEDQFHIALLALNAAVDAFSEFPITMQRSLVRVGWYEQ